MKLLAELVHSEYFAHAQAELLALARVAGDPNATISMCPLRPGQRCAVFAMVELSSQLVAQRICQRAMLVRGIYELFAEGDTYEEVLGQLHSDELSARLREWFCPERTYKFAVSGFGCHFSQDEQKERRDRFMDLVHPDQRARMKEPDSTFCLLEDVGLDDKGNGRGRGAVPYRVYFARQVAFNATKGATLNRLGLKKGRNYLGPTSMDAEISLLMANLGCARPASLVLDPFVGTGSILVACAHCGASTIGGDIDMRVLRGWIGTSNRTQKSVWKGGGGKPEDLEAAAAEDDEPCSKRCKVGDNFVQYGLADPCTIRCDNSVRVWRTGAQLFDVIVADPPYGVRAGAWKTGLAAGAEVKMARDADGKSVPGGRPPTVEYSADDVLQDLLQLAATSLVLGGRLVFFLPTVHGNAPTQTSTEGEDAAGVGLPSHPCMDLVDGGEEQLGGGLLWRRRLVTMEKVREHDGASMIP
eukprot:TRINITY_DN4732_c0_g2_i1.p1 TRINITY_DN4732_c0_g2~~TRINITY_DN4732_c0_g2_i1.p1  ORF type:complete len:471 (-),score=105.98 TRINITY_DN4732_c0_g2_i1:117-1529(-)